MDDVTPAPCAHDAWKVTNVTVDANPPKAEVLCRICGATQLVDELWLAQHPAVVAAARVTAQQHMIRPIQEML